MLLLYLILIFENIFGSKEMRCNDHNAGNLCFKSIELEF